MLSLDTLPRKYELLADHFSRQGESRHRDQCLVLAADAALSAGMPEEAERLRRRLLLTNPHHLVRPYSSMVEAMQAGDVRDLVGDLRKQWPPATVEKLLHTTNGGAGTPAGSTTGAKAKKPEAAASLTDPVSPLGVGLSMLFFFVGVVLSAAVLAAAFAGPWLP